MAVTADSAAPYAPPSAVLDIVQRHRNRGLPAIVDAAVLERCGITHSLVPRTLQALHGLDLLDADGRPTEIFEAIRLAPQSDYQLRLAEWLSAAYADALTFLDPATATESQIRDVFRHYKPIGQQPRMVTLFVGLFAAAGISADRRGAVPQQDQVSAAGRKPSSGAAVRAKRGDKEEQRPLGSGLPAPIQGLLTKLPSEEEGWSQQQRDTFIAALGAILDLCYPIRANGKRDGGPAAEDAGR